MSRSTIIFAIVIVLALGVLATAGCGADKTKTEAAADQTSGQEQAAPAAATVARGKGSSAPDFTLPKVGGGTLQLSSLRGKAVIVDFWDTWCPPCRKALPHLQELSTLYQDDLVVVGVALGREGEEKVRTYIQANGLTFEMVLFNNDMKLIQDFGGVESIPTTFLIDGEGIIREKWVGAYGKEAYEAGIKSVIGS